MRPNSYQECKILPYDLYCPSAAIDDVNYVCPSKECKKICTTKALLPLHLKATLQHSHGDESPNDCEDEEEQSVCNVNDGPCFVSDLQNFFMSTWEITYN